MILKAKDGLRGRIVDLDTGLEVGGVVWFDTTKGVIETRVKGVVKHYGGRFRFMPREPAAKKLLLGAPNCARCRSPLTIPGDDLCPGCRAKDRGRPYKLDSPLLDHRCGKCSRLATWAVGDEVDATPQVVDGAAFVRAATVGRRWYCDWHYRPPRLLDARGEPVVDFEDEARPK